MYYCIVRLLTGLFLTGKCWFNSMLSILSTIGVGNCRARRFKAGSMRPYVSASDGNDLEGLAKGMLCEYAWETGVGSCFFASLA